MRNCPGSAVGILAMNGEEDVKDDQQARGFSGIRGRTAPAAVDIWRIEDRCGIARIAERRTRGWIPPRANGHNPRKAPSSPGTSGYWMHSPCTQTNARDLRYTITARAPLCLLRPAASGSLLEARLWGGQRVVIARKPHI